MCLTLKRYSMEKETIYGEVVGKANNYMVVPDKKCGEGRLVKNDKIRAYEKSFVSQCRLYKDKLINGMFKLYAEVYYVHNGYDLDNSLKTILDCLQYCRAITNDKLCVSIIANKHIDRRNPRVTFWIEELEPTIKIFEK